MVKISVITDRRSNRARSPSPRSAVALNRKDERPPKASRPRRIPNRSRSIDARKKADQSLRTWQQTSSAPSCCCEDETKIWKRISFGFIVDRVRLV